MVKAKTNKSIKDIKEDNTVIRRLMKTNSTRDGIFLFMALFVILPIGIMFILVSYNIYKERKNFVKTHEGVSV